MSTHLGAEIRRLVLKQSKRANVGHIGSCLSIADIMAAMYEGILRTGNGDEVDRDRFVLSKGHAALALYAALHATGRLEKEDLDRFCTNGSALGTHPEHVVPGIDFSTGSLGHGLPMAVGAALGARMRGAARRVFVLLSDAECNEGSTWEAVMFAAQHKLANLVAIVDVNGQQALGYTREVLDLSPLAERFGSFGWDVHEADGHDPAGLANLIARLDTTSGAPHVVLAQTVFGSGVSFMESQIRWHYLPMNDDEYEVALAEVGAR
jgi:transketolase